MRNGRPEGISRIAMVLPLWEAVAMLRPQKATDPIGPPFPATYFPMPVMEGGQSPALTQKSQQTHRVESVEEAVHHPQDPTQLRRLLRSPSESLPHRSLLLVLELFGLASPRRNLVVVFCDCEPQRVKTMDVPPPMWYGVHQPRWEVRRVLATIALMALALVVPPVSVLLVDGLSAHLLLNIILWAVGGLVSYPIFGSFLGLDVDLFDLHSHILLH